MSYKQVDDELLVEFLLEMAELISRTEADLLTLELSADNTATVSSLFRYVHTIKGGAGIIGLDSLVDYTHAFESLLDEIRNNRLNLTDEIISLLLRSKDCLAGFLSQATGAGNLDEAEVAATRSAALRMIGATGPAAVTPPEVAAASTMKPVEQPAQVAPRMERERIYLVQFHAQPDRLPSEARMAALLAELGQLGPTAVTAHDMTLPAEEASMAGGLCLWRSVQVQTAASDADIAAIFQPLLGQCDVTIELLDDRFGAAEDQSEIGKNNALLPIAEKPASPSRAAESEATANEIMPAKALPSAAIGKARSNPLPTTSSSIRVDISKLDLLVNLVGELITISARLESFQDLVNLQDRALGERMMGILDDCTRSLRHLQNQAMTIRMVPIGGAFDPLGRLVRDYCQSSGKRIRLTTHGRDTEVDKKVSEQISGPLKHLIRNALDHGIESPEQRIAAGKSPEGEVTINAYNQYGLIVIEVSDDGNGIDVERIVQVAKQRGFMDPAKEPTEREALDLIFMPSLSSATEVTEISGRGVGMDVVKREIEELRGVIDVATRRGFGTTISVRMPITLLLVEGLLVEVAGNMYVIPLSYVEECVELANTDNRPSNFMDIREELVPFIRLRSIFNFVTDPQENEKVVIVAAGERRIGLVVDSLHGNHQSVIKGMSRLHKDATCFMGATIMADGGVVLILDVPRLLDVGHAREAAQRAA
jgi:two-component system chemotaxis sensor kinase CheA